MPPVGPFTIDIGGIGTRDANATANAAAIIAANAADPKPIAKKSMSNVVNIRPLVFREKENFFLDDSHIEGRRTMTRQQIYVLQQQFEQLEATYPGVFISFRQYFSPKAQAYIEDYLVSVDDDKPLWEAPYSRIIEVLSAIYPDPVDSIVTATAKARKAMIDWLIADLHNSNGVPWFYWRENTSLADM